MRVTVQDHKPLLALVDDCITVELERELFTVELRALVDFGEKVVRAAHFPDLQFFYCRNSPIFAFAPVGNPPAIFLVVVLRSRCRFVDVFLQLSAMQNVAVVTLIGPGKLWFFI